MKQLHNLDESYSWAVRSIFWEWQQNTEALENLIRENRRGARWTLRENRSFGFHPCHLIGDFYEPLIHFGIEKVRNMNWISTKSVGNEDEAIMYFHFLRNRIFKIVERLGILYSHNAVIQTSDCLVCLNRVLTCLRRIFLLNCHCLNYLVKITLIFCHLGSYQKPGNDENFVMHVYVTPTKMVIFKKIQFISSVFWLIPTKQIDVLNFLGTFFFYIEFSSWFVIAQTELIHMESMTGILFLLL